MASVLRAGAAHAIAWPLESVPAAPLPAAPPIDRPSGVAPHDDPATREALARVASLLAGAPSGLTLTQMRLALASDTEPLQRALAAGLRARRVRRLGSRSTLRYVLNS